MSILNRIITKSKFKRLIEILSNSLNNSVSLNDEIDGITVFSQKTNGFDFSRGRVELSFRVALIDNEIQIINDHRISRNKRKGNASIFLNDLIEIFKLVAQNHNKKRLSVIFEIQGYLGTKPEETKQWLEKLGFQKTQDKKPEKYIKYFEVE